MSYTVLERQIHSIPEEYLDEVARFLDNILFKVNKDRLSSDLHDTSEYYGCIAKPIDGLKAQKDIRDEWD